MVNFLVIENSTISELVYSIIRNNSGSQPQERRCVYENPHFRTGTPERFTGGTGQIWKELAQETGISKSALGSYENDNDEYKEINHGGPVEAGRLLSGVG